MFEPTERHDQSHRRSPIPGIPYEAWRTRARYQLVAVAVLCALFFALAILGPSPAPTGETTVALHEPAEAPPVEEAMQAYERVP